MADMRSLLQALTVPDTTVVAQATTAIRAKLRDQASLGALLSLLSDADGTIRQLAAVLLRRALPERAARLSAEDQTAARNAVLSALSAEPGAGARSALIALAAALAGSSSWPELTASALSGQAGGLQMLAALADAAPGPMFDDGARLAGVLGAALSARAPHSVRAYTAIMRAASVVDGDVFPSLVALLPKLGDAVREYAKEGAGSDEFARVVADSFECCQLGSEAGGEAMKPFFAGSVALAVELFGAREAADEARAAAAEYLMFAAMYKPKTFRKLGIATAVLTTACEVAAQHRVPEGNEEIEDGEEEHPPDVALRVLDTMARRPELSELVFGAVIAAAAALLERARVDTVQADRDAHCAVAFRITGVIAEGCSAQVTQHAADVVEKLAAGAADTSLCATTRANALEALGYVCDSLDSDEMQETVVSAVGGVALNALLSGMRHPVLLVRRHACMALEPVLSLCLVDVQTLQPRVTEIIGALGSMGVDAAVEAVMAVGILAENAPDEFIAYERMSELIQGTLSLMSRNDEDGMLARAAGIETAGALVAVCENTSIVEQLAAIAVSGLDVDEPNVKRATYSFFARMADAIGGKVVAAYGPRVLSAAVESMKRDDVVFEPNEDDSSGGFQGLMSAVADGENIANGDGEDGDDEDPAHGTFHVRTAFLDEKMLAVSVCGAFAAAADNAEYVAAAEKNPESAKAVQSLLSNAAGMIDTLAMYFHEDVRAAANKAGVRMAIANVRLASICPGLVFDDSEVLATTAQRIAYAIEEDDDSWVVTNVLNAATVFCDELPPQLLAQHKSTLLNPLQTLINGNAVCQVSEEDDFLDAGDDNEASEEVSTLVSGIGDLVEALVRNQRGLFAQDFTVLFPKLLENMFSPSASHRNKAMVFGAVAGVLLFMNWDRCTKFQPPAPGSAEYEAALSVSDSVGAAILPHALEAVASKQGMTLQRNAVFLIGIVFARARVNNQGVWTHLQRTVHALQEYLLAEKSSDNAALVDNAAGAVARILTAPGLRPSALGNRATALQLLMRAIPMEGDPTENTTVARAIMEIAESDSSLIVPFVEPVVSSLTSAVLLAIHQAKPEQNKVKQNAERDDNDEMTKLTQEESAKMVQVLSQIRTQYGDAPFTSLGLSAEDAAALGKVL